MCVRRAWLALLILGASASAGAQDAEIETLIERGVALREQGRDAEARDLFEQAYRRSSSSRALAQLALAEQALGEWVAAYQHLASALAAGGAWIDERRQPLEESLARIAQHVGRLELSGGVPGAEVRVNGEPAGAFPLSEPLVVPTGTLVVEVSAAGYETMRRTIEMRPGGHARERFSLVRNAEAGAGTGEGSSTPSTEAPPPGGGGVSPVGIAVLAVGAAAAVAGGILGGVALAQDTDARGRCVDSRCSSDAYTAIADAHTMAIATDALLWGGLAVAVTGVVLMFVLGDEGGAGASATCTPDGCGLVVLGGF